MDAASIVPWNFAYSDKPSELYVFFRTEQFNRVLGFVRVAAPDGYKFDTGGNGACVVRTLPEYYYARRTYGQFGGDTLRLPGYVNCMERKIPYNHAEIKLEG